MVYQDGDLVHLGDGRLDDLATVEHNARPAPAG